MSKKLVEEKEWEALWHLAEVTYEELRVAHESVCAQLEKYKAIDAQRVHALSMHDLTIAHLRSQNLEQHKLILQMQKRLAELEPVRIQTPQPAFKRT